MSDKKKNLAADRAAGAAKPQKPTLKVKLGEQLVELKGRAAQTLLLLIQKGSRGFTSGEASPLGWAKRTSHYIHQLRKLGFEISTVPENAGEVNIGRYVLVQRVFIVGRCGL